MLSVFGPDLPKSKGHGETNRGLASAGCSRASSPRISATTTTCGTGAEVPVIVSGFLSIAELVFFVPRQKKRFFVYDGLASTIHYCAFSRRQSTCDVTEPG